MFYKDVQKPTALASQVQSGPSPRWTHRGNSSGHPGPEEGTGATLGEPSGVPDLGKKSTASWRQRSHTFLRQSQLSML